MGSNPMRVLAYCHDGVGLGHLRRTLNICQRLSADFARSTYLVATGSPYISLFSHIPGVDYLKLPALRKVAADTYIPKYLDLEEGQLQRCREALLFETVRHFDPDVLLVDKAPVGVCGELTATLKWLRRHKPQARIVFGMRDIEDEPTATVQQWSHLGVPDMLESCFDEVWVYGMRDVFDVAVEYKLSARIREKLRFMGYVARSSCAHNGCAGVTARQVLVTVGGGTDGADVLGTYLAEAASRVAQVGGRSVVVSGPDLPPDAAEILSRQAAGLSAVEWIDFAPCLCCLIRRSALAVCMGGYNTLCEIVTARRPALVIPRTRPRMEQAIRAKLWEQRGLVRVIDPAELNAHRLAEEVLAGLGRPTTADAKLLDLGGLDRVSERLAALMNGGGRRAAAVPVH